MAKALPKSLELEICEQSSRAVRYVPNALSVSRVFLSFLLVQIKPFTHLFFVVYLLCGATDFLDGHIARKYHVESSLGSTLDSLADFAFFAAALYVFLTALAVPVLILVWAIALIVGRFACILAASFEFGVWAALHTFANKLTAFAFFALPFSCLAFGVVVSGVVVCALGTYAAVEEAYINKHVELFDADIKSAYPLLQKQ